MLSRLNLLAALIPPMLACIAPAQAAADPDRYIFVLTARNNPYWDTIQAGIEETARARGVAAVVYRTQDATAAEEQLNTCLAAIEQHPKAIVMAAITPGVGLQCLKKASTAGIVVGDIDANTTVEDARRAGIPLAFSVGSDNGQLGARAADYAAALEREPSPHVLVLEGAPGSIPGNKRVDGFRDRLRQLKPDAVVASLPADWDTGRAMNAVNDTLQREPDLALVFAANDTMALGAVEAVRSAGKREAIKVIGIDGIAAARKAILAGDMAGSVAQLPYLMGKRALDLAIDAVAGGGRTGVTEATPIPLLTKPVLDRNTDPNLKYVR